MADERIPRELMHHVDGCPGRPPWCRCPFPPAAQVYVVVLDEDPGYSTPRFVGAYSSRERADARIASVREMRGYLDVVVIEAALDDDDDQRIDDS